MTLETAELLAVIAAGVIGAWLVRLLWLECRPNRVPVLCYHRLVSKVDALAGRVPDREAMWVCYDDAFAEQMQWLAASGWTPIDLDDFLAIRDGRRRRPRNPIVITFDDGYRSNYTLAFPVLARHGFKAVIFVALEPDQHTRRQVEGIDGFLTCEQLRAMAERGVSIQSHTLTHRILTELDNESVRYELLESRRRLESITGRPVRHFCYPRAGVDRRVRALVAEAGYATACGRSRGTAGFASPTLHLPRIGVERDMSLTAFRWALRPPASLLYRLAGSLKILPARLLGARAARRLRDRLYIPGLLPWFGTARLAAILFVASLLTTASGALWLWLAIS